MSNKIKNFGELLRKYGYSIPVTEEDVLAFENKYQSSFESPSSWETVDSILNQNEDEVKTTEVCNDLIESIKYLSMAAREGNQISKDVIKKMKEDRDNARKK